MSLSVLLHPFRSVSRKINLLQRVPLNVSAGDTFRWHIPDTNKLSSFTYTITGIRVCDGRLIVDGQSVCGAGIVKVSRPIEQIQLIVDDEPHGQQVAAA